MQASGEDVTEETYGERSPKKKIHTPQIQRIQHELLASPAWSNELLELELPGAWEPRGYSRASQYCEARRARSPVCYGDKNSEKRVEALQNQLGIAGCFAGDSRGLSGGIGLFWSDELDVELKNLQLIPH